MNAEKYLLETVDWQFFCSFSFKSLKESRDAQTKRYFAVMREQAENFGVHFSKPMWALRHEFGELTGRPHFHSLIAGLPDHAVNPATCFSFMKIWEKHGGGMARVRVYDATLPGVDYVLGGIDAAYANAGANWYELNKFGDRCDVMLSMSLIRHLENRQRFGHRDRGGKLHDINGCEPNKRATPSDKSRRIDTPGTHRKAE
jgi:hypothetical protein